MILGNYFHRIILIDRLTKYDKNPIDTKLWTGSIKIVSLCFSNISDLFIVLFVSIVRPFQIAWTLLLSEYLERKPTGY